MNPDHPFELLLGTRNPGKVREMKKLLADLHLRMRSLDDFPDLGEVDETGSSYEENSKIKALTYSSITKLPAIADDSGLEVDALDGKPGPLSARFGGEPASDSDRLKALLSALDQNESKIRTARFICCLTLAGWDGNEAGNKSEPSVIRVVRGELNGTIVSEPRGRNGFGYDPIFVPTGFMETLGELPVDVKNRISHRASALVQMRAFLAAWIRQTLLPHNKIYSYGDSLPHK